jgi:chaperonin GroEL
VRCCAPQGLDDLKLPATSRSASTSSAALCEEPLRQIAGNAGFEGAIVIEKVRSSND